MAAVNLMLERYRTSETWRSAKGLGPLRLFFFTTPYSSISKNQLFRHFLLIALDHAVASVTSHLQPPVIVRSESYAIILVARCFTLIAKLLRLYGPLTAFVQGDLWESLAGWCTVHVAGITRKNLPNRVSSVLQLRISACIWIFIGDDTLAFRSLG